MTDNISANGTDMPSLGEARRSLVLYLAGAGAGIFLWWFIYGKLASVAAWLTYDLFGIENGSLISLSLETPKIMNAVEIETRPKT